MMRTNRAFTLIEILLTVTIMAVVAVAIMQGLSNGLKLWQRGQGVNSQMDAAICFDKMSQYVRNAVVFDQIPFVGSETRMSFAVLMEGDRLGAVAFEFDPALQVIHRKRADYGRALKKAWSTQEVLCQNVENMRLRYYIPGEKQFEIASVVDQKWPHAVTIAIHLKDTPADEWLSRTMPVMAKRRGGAS